MNPYLDPAASAGEIADYLYSQNPQLMIPAFQQLNDAIEVLDEHNEVCDLIDEQQPSALVLMVDPRSTGPNNCQARILGDPDLLVQVLLLAARDNEAFRDALTDALPQLLTLASER